MMYTSMLDRVSPRKVARLFRRDLPRPIDVLNLLTISDLESYRWYGLLVAPLVYGTGGSVPWGGALVAHLHGPRVADRLLVARYRSHRAWIAMVTNPYYLLINRLRERGVARFEASFAAPIAGASLAKRDLLVVVAFDAPGDARLEALTCVVEGAGGELAYAAREAAPIDFFKDASPTDPNPLRFKRIAFFAFPTLHSIDRARAKGLVTRIVEEAGDCAVQVYRREPARAHFPALFQRVNAPARTRAGHGDAEKTAVTQSVQYELR